MSLKLVKLGKNNLKEVLSDDKNIPVAILINKNNFRRKELIYARTEDPEESTLDVNWNEISKDFELDRKDVEYLTGCLNNDLPVMCVHPDYMKIYEHLLESKTDESMRPPFIEKDRDEVIYPLPCLIRGQRTTGFVIGKNGSGKSTYMSKFVKAFKILDNLLRCNRNYFLISKKKEDPVLDKLGMVRLNPFDKNFEKNIKNPSQFKQQVVLFDDIENFEKDLLDKIHKFRDELLELNRSDKIHVMASSHRMYGYNSTKILLTESNMVTFFPNNTMHHMKKYLKENLGLENKTAKKITSLRKKSCWITIYTGRPMYCLHEHGCFLI